jgi:hypothetical protein
LILLILLLWYPDAVPGESVEGSVMFSIRLYVAENDETLNLVEGERVIVLGKTTPLLNYSGFINALKDSCMSFEKDVLCNLKVKFSEQHIDSF